MKWTANPPLINQQVLLLLPESTTGPSDFKKKCLRFNLNALPTTTSVYTDIDSAIFVTIFISSYLNVFKIPLYS